MTKIYRIIIQSFLINIIILITSINAGVLDKFKKDATIQCGLFSSRIDGQDFTEDF